MKRAPNEKECRALTLSRRRPSTTSSSSSNEAARPPQPVTARDRGSQKVERRDNRKKRHRQGRINFGAITPAAPEREAPEPPFQSRVVGRLYQTPGACRDGRMNHGHVVECGAVAPLFYEDVPPIERLFSKPV
jgi:hypothetical protein